MKNYIRINTGFTMVDYIICITCLILLLPISIYANIKILTYYSFDWLHVFQCVVILIFIVYFVIYYYEQIKYFHTTSEIKAIDINYDEIIFNSINEKIIIKQNIIKKFLLIHNGLDVQIKIVTDDQTFNFDFPTTNGDCFYGLLAEKIQKISPNINNFEYMANSQLCEPRITKHNIHFVSILVIFSTICLGILSFINFPSEKYKNLIVTKDFETSSKIAEYLISNDYNVSINNDDLYTLQVKNTAKKDSYTALLLLWENNKLNSDTHLVKGFNIKSLIKHKVNGVIDAGYKFLNKNEADNKEVLIDLVVEQNADIEKIKTQITNLLQASIENLKEENIKFSIKKQ